MNNDYNVINSIGTKYHYVDNGNNIIIYTNSDSNTLEIPKKDRFLFTLINDVKDLRTLKDMENIKKMVKDMET